MPFILVPNFVLIAKELRFLEPKTFFKWDFPL